MKIDLQVNTQTLNPVKYRPFIQRNEQVCYYLRSVTQGSICKSHTIFLVWNLKVHPSDYRNTNIIHEQITKSPEMA